MIRRENTKKKNAKVIGDNKHHIKVMNLARLEIRTI